jgi:hypothetical protein
MKLYPLLLSASLMISGVANAQIFIETGNPNTNKYKQDSSLSSTTTPVDATAAPITDTSKVVSAPKIAAVKVKQSAPALVNKTTPPPSHPSDAPLTTKASSSTPEYTGTLSDANDNLPPNAEVGKCYARCFVADKFDFKEEMVVDKPLSYKTQTIPATYKTVFDTVVTKPASVRTEEIAAVYETVVEDIMVSPATQKWVKGTADAGCLSANPADCQVLCLQQVPAVYKKVSRKIVKTPAYKQDFPIAAEYKIVSKQVVDQPARQEQIEIPATYKKVMHKELIRKGGYSEWKEILCGDKLTADKIIAIQKALKANGYDPGPLDDIFGAETKAALVKYQQDKNLPVGNLNMETLKSLGVE